MEQRILAAGAAAGDTVRVTGGAGTQEGVLMPRHAFSGKDVLILKLASGYNVGIRLGPQDRVELVRHNPPRARPGRSVKSDSSLPLVQILGTGGTIASYVDYRTGAVHPAATADELAFANPEIFKFCQVRAEVVFQEFSEDLAPRHWLELARRVKASFDSGARGVVVPHGTDTLAFTASALGFLLRDLPGPVVVVGSQRSSDRPSSDASLNLGAACRIAALADLGEVVACMHATSDDSRLAIHRGVRCRKNHTSRRDAFESINAAPLGHVEGEDVVLDQPHRPRAQGPCRLYAGIAEDVSFIQSYPGLDGSTIEAIVRGRGALLVGTGLGHVPRRTLDSVARLQKKGVVVAMASQCIWGRVDLKVYSTGRDLLERGVLPAQDMTAEAAFAKLCWALGNASTVEEAKALFAEDQVGETDPRTRFEATA